MDQTATATGAAGPGGGAAGRHAGRRRYSRDRLQLGQLGPVEDLAGSRRAIWLRFEKLGPAECPRSAKKIVFFAHGFHIFNVFPHHGRPEATVDRGGKACLR